MPTRCTFDEAVALVRPTDSIGFGLGPANPDGFLTALGARHDWEDLTLGGALCLNLYEVFTQPGVSYRCGFFGPAERLLHSMGHRIELVPGGFRQMAPILAPLRPAHHGGAGGAARRGRRGEPLAPHGGDPAPSCSAPGAIPSGS